MRVLRLTEGDQVQVTNGIGGLWLARISAISKKSCVLRLEQALDWHRYWTQEISLYIAPTKSIERMEWLLEKAVEIGVDHIVLIKCAHSERKHIKAERLQKIMLSAMKQSQKALLPSLEVDVPFKEAVLRSQASKSLIFHCRTSEGTSSFQDKELPHKSITTSDKSLSLFIGPEGDFSVEEVLYAEQAGLLPSTLGDSRLRTETAALTALQWVHILQSIS